MAKELKKHKKTTIRKMKKREDDSLSNIGEVYDLSEKIDDNSTSMFKFNLIVPYSDAPNLRPILWKL